MLASPESPARVAAAAELGGPLPPCWPLPWGGAGVGAPCPVLTPGGDGPTKPPVPDDATVTVAGGVAVSVRASPESPAGGGAGVGASVVHSGKQVHLSVGAFDLAEESSRAATDPTAWRAAATDTAAAAILPAAAKCPAPVMSASTRACVSRRIERQRARASLRVAPGFVSGPWQVSRSMAS